MKIIFSAILFSLASFISCEDIASDEGVLVLKKTNFEKAITDNEFVLVEFCKYFIIIWVFLNFLRLIY